MSEEQIKIWKEVEAKGLEKLLIQTEYQKEQFSPKTSSFRGFLYIPMNPSGTTKTQKNLTVANR